MSREHHDRIVATCIRALPNEGCGLLVGTVDGVVTEVVPSDNVAQSAKVYEINPSVLLRTFRSAESRGEQVIGVFHSHTHTDAFPSATDQAQAPDPSWHYVLVSFRLVPTVLRSYRIVDGTVNEEEVTVLAD